MSHTLLGASAFAAHAFVSAPLLVAPWLAAGSVTLLFGPPSAGKTHLTISMACALRAGEPLWGIFPCQRSRVLVVQADMNTALYQERVRPNADALTDDVTIWATDALPFDVCKLKSTDAIVGAVREFAPAVVFVDTLRKTHSFDENDSTAPDRVYAAWRSLFPGAAFVFLHHSRKVSTQPGNSDTVIREAFRGSGAWAASADTIIMLKRARRANNLYWMTRLHFVRTRSCAEPASILLKLNERLLLEPFVGSPLEEALLAWISTNPRAKRAEAVAWLTSQTKEDGTALCAQATAYRAWDRVVRGEEA